MAKFTNKIIKVISMDGSQIFFRLLNPFTRAIAKSPLHTIISRNIIVLIFPGKISGKTYSIPVSYLKSTNKELFCLTEKEYIWWRNLIDYNTIQILLEGKLLNAEVEVEFENDDLIAEKLTAMCLHSKIDAYFANVGFKNNIPVEEDIIAAASNMTLIKLSIN
jgi:hypothetical protein